MKDSTYKVATDGNILGVTRKGYIMEINLQNYLDRISTLGTIQVPTQSDASQNLNIGKTSEMDSFISSVSDLEETMPSMNYGANGMMVGDLPPAPPSEGFSPIENTEGSSTDFMDTLSQAFRANADSIQMTMDSLGLTIEDLADETNMATLASAMNDGAVALGVPTVENLDEVVSNLVQQAKGVSEISSNETAAVEETQNSSTGSSTTGSGSSSSSSEDETTVEVVVINGMRYLENSTVENGVAIPTRQPLDSVETI